jgi:hypothetical protein
MRKLVNVAYHLPEPDIVTAERDTGAFATMETLGASLPQVINTPDRRRSAGLSRSSLPTPRHSAPTGSRNRTSKQRRTDFGIGFLGEFFVSLLYYFPHNPTEYIRS